MSYVVYCEEHGQSLRHGEWEPGSPCGELLANGHVCTCGVSVIGLYGTWGKLVDETKPTRQKRPPMSPQEQAARKLAHARKQMSVASARIRRATTSLRLWEKRAAYYAKRASMTDAEYQAEVARRKVRAPKPKRGIKIGGVV